MITLKDIINEYALDSKELAQELFPDRLYPELAMARILKYSQELTLRQICIIAKAANCNPIDLAITLINNK